MEGLRHTLLERFIEPYRRYRGNEKQPGIRCTFENFLQKRPDGGEILQRNGKQIGAAARQWELRRPQATNAAPLIGERQLLNAPLSAWGELFVICGIDPMRVSLNELLTRDDDFKWLAGPWIADTVWRGYVGEPTRWALWAQLCFQVGTPVMQESMKMVKLWFTGRPAPTGEFEQVPSGKLQHSDETVSWKKIAWKLEMSNEFLRFSPIQVIEPWLLEVGLVQQVAKDLACVNAIVNGTSPTGSQSCPIIGVKSPLGSTDAKGLQYVDFLEPWGWGKYLGQRWFRMIHSRKMSETIGQIEEFKLRYLGTPIVGLGDAPEPTIMDRHISPAVPDHQVILMDDVNCVRERVAIPFHVLHDDDLNTYSQALSFFESYCFEKVGEKSCIGVDETLLRGQPGAAYGMPEWMDLGIFRKVA